MKPAISIDTDAADFIYGDRRHRLRPFGLIDRLVQHALQFLLAFGITANQP
jgi:hypothetical protein